MRDTMAGGRWRALLLVGFAELFAMTLWFSASAVSPELTQLWELSDAQQAWLTNAVQLGFVVGALLSASLTISDTFQPRYVFAGSAVLGAAATAVLAAFVTTALPAILLRFVTGVALAGVYPTGMKMMAGWFKTGRGMAIGVLVGALTVGSAAPHLLRVIGGVGNPRLVLYGSATIALVGAVLALFYREGPYQPDPSPFDPRALGRILRDRSVILANGGYFGHMWELYAVWTWIPVFLVASFTHRGVRNPQELASLLTFGTIAVGGIGAWLAGSAADRWGRTTVTATSMIVSGSATVLAGFVFGAPVWVVAPFVLLWGFVIVADSAQFSAAVSELADPGYVGSALTFQTAIGFLLTIGSIQLTPKIAEMVGWRWAFAPLLIGPLLGTISMVLLRRHPDANKLAEGVG
ncbi:MFS transporter [Natrinema caseinilyticum]|uniref:MFS transporter n=1 Tax=Natrinema caseinilyticum TaxID=2961570 RepID=UPI0020C3D476|nr:MFS transporter [Natrinema caseinilyticum]